MSTTKSVVVTADTALVTTAETVVATLPGVFEGASSPPITLEGFAQVTTGASTTGLTIRIRRGTDATGTLVGEGNVETLSAAAGGTEERNINVTDTPAEGGPYTYVLTVQQTAASANGSCLQASLTALTAGPSGT